MAKILAPRKMGSTGIEVSPMAFGTVKVGRNQKVKNACGDGFELPSDEMVSSLIDLCLDLGINFVDTAPAYGIAEERLGEILGSRRQEMVLFTKAGEDFIGGESKYDFSYKHTIESVERSLRRLKTDVLDGVLVHCDNNELEIIRQAECLEALDKLKERGDIRSFGMSTKTVEGGKKAVDLADVVMVAANPIYTAENEVIAYAHQKKKGVLVKKALLQGHLDELGEDPVGKCMDHALGLEGVTSLVLGTLNEKHLRDNVQKMEIALGLK